MRPHASGQRSLNSVLQEVITQWIRRGRRWYPLLIMITLGAAQMMKLARHEFKDLLQRRTLLLRWHEVLG